jgi:uncharacterized repeat protein (TIGR01451 family)
VTVTTTRKFAATFPVVFVAALAMLGSTRSTASDQPPGMTQPCGAGFAYGVINGVPTCMRRGLLCYKRFESQYHAYGFKCQRGRLAERHPFRLRADLSLTNVDTPDPVRVGEELTYSLTVGNHGPGRATGVYLFDALGLTGVTANYVSSAASQGSCTQTQGAVFCQLGNVAVEETARVTIVVRLLGAAVPRKANHAFVESGRIDPYFRSNRSDIWTTVLPSLNPPPPP